MTPRYCDTLASAAQQPLPSEHSFSGSAQFLTLLIVFDHQVEIRAAFSYASRYSTEDH